LQAFVNAKLNNEIRGAAIVLQAPAMGIERIAEVPIYAADALVRRAASLQKSADAKNAKIAFLASDVFTNLGLSDGADVRIVQGTGAAILKAKIDATLPAGCVRVAAAISETSALDSMFGAVTVEKISLAAAAD
jgi:NADH-quinone oxidoreductase subunit G